ncbi:hypothetical protein FGRMN_4197 [Fusarium graminum]|nr:hypothetical protein FGRMN_4197 [Fusarium graminum]
MGSSCAPRGINFLTKRNLIVSRLKTSPANRPHSHFDYPVFITINLIQVLANVKDPEKGATPQVPKTNKKCSIFKKIVIGFVLLVLLLAAMFGMGIAAAIFTEAKIPPGKGVIILEPPLPSQFPGFPGFPEFPGGYTLARRDEVAGASYPISTKTALSTLYGISYFTTHEVVTEVETITGTIYVTVPNEVQVSISTNTIESSSEYCDIEVVTMTETYTVTITPGGGYSATSNALPEATVTGNPETVTDNQTGFTLTKPLPDVTVSGNPETVTETQTDFTLTHGLPEATVIGNAETVTNTQIDFTLTHGLPEATVTGNPETVTDNQTGFILTNRLPDATVSGNPETVTDIYHSSPITGIHTTIVVPDLYPSGQAPRNSNPGMATVTVTVPYVSSPTAMTASTTVPLSGFITVTAPCELPPPIMTMTEPDLTEPTMVLVSLVPIPPNRGTQIVSMPSSTLTQTVYETVGEPSTSTKTVQVPVSLPPPYPTANNTLVTGPSGSITYVPVVPTPSPDTVTVSGSTKKPEPRGWGGTSGTTNLSCTIMLIAIIMFAL